MTVYTKLFKGSQLQDKAFLRRMLARIIFLRLQRLGFMIDDTFAGTIESKLSMPDLSGFSLEFDDAQVPVDFLGRNGATSPEDIKLDLGDLDLELNEVVGQFMAEQAETLPKMVHEISSAILNELRHRAAGMLRKRRTDISSFESGIAERWKKPLDLLEMFIVVCLETGEEFNREWHESEAGEEEYVFEVLVRLHARACQVASEILALLRTGHADGAHARWRCLHEIAVVGFFVAAHGDTVAKRYLLHDSIECYKAALQYTEHSQALGLEPLTPKELSELKSTRDELIKCYGSEYGSDYGWAAEAIGKERPTFSDIEERAGLDHMRPYYKLASHNVHANARGVFFKLGLMPSKGDILLAGPSNFGLSEPGQGCALSIFQVSVALLTAQPNLDRLLVCEIIQALEREVGEAFQTVQIELEKEEET